MINPLFNEIQFNIDQSTQEYQANLQIIQVRYMVPLEGWLKTAVGIVGIATGLDYILYYDEGNSTFWVNPNKGVDVSNAVFSELLKLEKANPIVIPGR